MTISPPVANVFALLAIIGDVRCLETPAKRVAYIGLNPGQRESGRGKNIKLFARKSRRNIAVAAVARRPLVQVGHTLMGNPPEALETDKSFAT